LDQEIVFSPATVV